MADKIMARTLQHKHLAGVLGRTVGSHDADDFGLACLLADVVEQGSLTG